MIKMKTLNRGVKSVLSKNFKSSEIDCKGKNCCSVTEYAPELIERLQWMRDKCGKPLVLNSAFRCAAHNKEVGGTSGSRHLHGMAADVAVPKGMNVNSLAALAESAGFRGVLKYTVKNFVHVDVRDCACYYADTANGSVFKAVATHGGNIEKNPGVIPEGTVKRGSSDKTAVMWIQWALNKAGFDCGKVDGVFGSKTLEAVKSFQASKKLSADGMVGLKETVPALRKATEN